MKNSILRLKRKMKPFLALLEIKFKVFDNKRFCFYCEKERTFLVNKSIILKIYASCSKCGINLRNNAVLEVLKEHLKDKDLSNISIYNTASLGYIHNYLEKKKLEFKKYVFSDYKEGVKSGDFINGIRNENLENLSFKDQEFDIVISEEVFEHIENYKKAFKEIARILKTGGVHIFTIPFHENNETQERVINGEHVYGLVLHGDYLRESIPVITDFGYNIVDIIKKETGMETKIIYKDRFFKKEEITWIYNEEYKKYLEHEKEVLKYFKYNNIVLISKK